MGAGDFFFLSTYFQVWITLFYSLFFFVFRLHFVLFLGGSVFFWRGGGNIGFNKGLFLYAWARAFFFLFFGSSYRGTGELLCRFVAGVVIVCLIFGVAFVFSVFFSKFSSGGAGFSASVF